MKLFAGIALLFSICSTGAGQGDGGAGAPSDSLGGADYGLVPASGESLAGSSDSSATSADSGASSASDVEKSVPAYPPLGEKSAALDKWTREGVLRQLSQNNEDSFKDRFNLQKALIAAVDEKNASMAGIMAMIDDAKAKMVKFNKKQQNVTTILYADASAGGLVASSRNVRNEIPATRKLLTSTMDKQLQNLQKDAAGLKNLVLAAESEYRQRIKAMADTVSSIIIQQDAAFARRAAQQARAMARTSQNLQQKALSDAREVNSNLTTIVATGSSVISKAAAGVQTARVALNDVEDSLGEVESQYKSALEEVKSDVSSTVDKQVDKSIGALDKAADTAGVSLQTSAMSIGQQMTRQLDQLDRSANQLVSRLLYNATKVTDRIAKNADKTEASTQSAVDSAEADATKQVANLDSQSQLVLSDQLKISQDMQAMIQQQQATSSSTGSGFATDVAKLLALIAQSTSGVSAQAKAVSQDVVGGTSSETIRLNQALTYLLQQASSGSSGISAGAESQLATQQKAQADQLSQRQYEIGAAGDSLNAAVNDASKAALRGASSLSDRVAGIGSTYGASIGGLLSSVTDATGSAKDAFNQLQGLLGGQAADSLNGIVDALKMLNNNGVDSKEDFLKTVVGPSRDGSVQSMTQVQSLLSGLSKLLGTQSEGQDGTLEALRAFQLNNSEQLKGASNALNGIQSLNNQVGNRVEASGQKGIAENRARMVAALLAEVNAAKNQSADGLHQIDLLVNSLARGSLSDNLSKIGQTLAVAGANLDASGKDFVKVERDQIKSLAGLSSMAASLLGDSNNAGIAQKAESEAALVNARSNIVAKFKEIAANTTDTDLGKVMADLAKQGNDTAIVNFLLGDVESAIKRINSDTVAARDANDKRRADFEAYLAQTQAQLQQAQSEVVAQLNKAIADVQKALSDKRDLLQGSEAEMRKALQEIKSQVEKAQVTLSNNLSLYQSKLDDIIEQIRSYMNLSTEADELAIQKDIARQLEKVNATEVSVASANAAVAEQVAKKTQSTAEAESHILDVVGGVIDGAIETQSSVSDSHLSQSDKLVAVAAHVDEAATELNGSIKSASALMENGIAKSSDTASRAIANSEADQAKTVGQVNDRSADVASKSRKNFITNLERMGAVDDDTLRVSKQLAQLIDSVNSTISDISETTLSHLDLSVDTVAKLNSAEVRKVASVGDVMGTFSAVVLGFLNETSSSMETIMTELNSVDAASRTNLKQIDTRSRDELNSVGTRLNATSDTFVQILEQERTAQEAIKAKLFDDESAFKISEAKKGSEINDVEEQVTALKQKLSQQHTDQIAKVRSWINQRSPQIGKALFPSAGALLEVNGREAVIRDIRKRINRIESDISTLKSSGK